MLRGVSKQIIEINQTGNRYFERAVLYVSNDFIGDDEELLSDEASRIVTAMSKPPISATVKKRRTALLRAALIVSYPVLAIVVFILAKAG